MSDRLNGERGDLADVLQVLDLLTDSTFLLLHTLDKGYRYTEQKDLVSMVLRDAMRALREYGVAPEGCEKCGSREPDSSHWHASHCVPSGGSVDA